jgi:hypothetical protein
MQMGTLGTIGEYNALFNRMLQSYTPTGMLLAIPTC